MSQAEVMGVELRANFSQFEKALLKAQNKTEASLSAVERKFAAANRRVKSEGDKLGSALGGFQKAGAGLLGQIPGLTGGINSLGLAGAAGAIGVGALVSALQSIGNTTKWADDLAAAADKIGITSEALQGLRYAADETDIPLADLDSGLQALNASLGAFKSGIGAKRITPIFKALGLTQDDLKDVHNANELLPILADRLGRVQDTATRVKLAKALGIENLEPLLRQGADGLARMDQEARRLGLVMSNEVTNGLADANRELERNQQVIDANVRSMQANLAPFFVWVTRQAAKAAHSISDMLARGRRSYSEGGFSGLDFITRFMPRRERPRPEDDDPMMIRQHIAALGPETDPAPAVNLDLPATGGGGRHGRVDRSAQEAQQRTRAFEDALASAQAGSLQAQSQIATTATMRAAIATQLLDSEQAQRQAQLDRQVADKDLTTAQRAEIVEAEKGAWEAKRAGVALTLKAALIEDQNTAEDRQRGFLVDMLNARAATATTLEERLAIDRDLLTLHQAERRRLLERAITQEGISDAEKAMLQAMLDQLAAVENAEQGALLSPGAQGGKDALDRARAQYANSNADPAAKDRQDALDYIAKQEADGVASHEAAMQARADIDRAYWQHRLAGEGGMLDQLATLQNSNIKELAAIGKAAAITQATIDGVLAVQNALAHGGPFPLNLVAAAIVGAQAAANVAAIAGTGFRSGGYTGDGAEGAVAGAVHGKEYVFDAAATRRIGKPALDALRSGSPLIGSVSRAAQSVGGQSAVAGQVFHFAPVIDARGADTAAVMALGKVVAQQQKDFRSNVEKIMLSRSRWRLGTPSRGSW